jgi:hypothetical protein
VLRAAGHEVHAVTLTGDGDRAHLRHWGIELGDHLAAVVAAVQAEELQQIVLGFVGLCETSPLVPPTGIEPVFAA